MCSSIPGRGAAPACVDAPRACASRLTSPRSLQGLLYPAVAQPNLMLGFPTSRENAARSDRSTSPGISEHLLDHSQRHPLRAGLSQSPIQQSVIAILLVPPVPPPHLSVGDPDDLRCLPPGNLLRQSSQDHFLNLHRPLQGGHRVAVHACLQACIFSPSRF
jgi:hypothetical protein